FCIIVVQSGFFFGTTNVQKSSSPPKTDAASFESISRIDCRTGLLINNNTAAKKRSIKRARRFCILALLLLRGKFCYVEKMTTRHNGGAYHEWGGLSMIFSLLFSKLAG